MVLGLVIPSNFRFVLKSMPPKKRILDEHQSDILKYMKRNRNDEETDPPEPNHGNDESVDLSEKNPNCFKKEKFQLKFQEKWKTTFGKWLEYDKEKNIMWCSSCREIKLTNTMAMGTNNFKTTTIARHIESADHKRAVMAPKDREKMNVAISTADSKEEKAITVCMKAVYWLAKESIPLSKYQSLIGLLNDLQTPHTELLNVGEKVNYSSYNTANDMLESISDIIDNKVTEKLQQSPVLTIMTDESTDIAVHHKLCVTARVINPDTMVPSTLFLTDLHISSATGKAIFDEIKHHLEKRGIPVKAVTGLGTDGASVMTGRKEGLTGHFLRENPHLINTHCSAHKIALCSEQAAESIPAMKYYQQILESLFYYFKKSPKRNDEVSAVQKLLDEPTLRYREVHQVRWLSFYQALDTVYRTLDSLITYFSSKQGDPKATGLKKKLSEDFFIYMTYSLMDTLQPVMKLNLFFQRKDIDIGLVQTSVDTCIADLVKLRDNVEDPIMSGLTFTEQIKSDLVNGIYKSQHQISTSKYSFESTRVRFIQNLIDNINARFPDKDLMTSFCVFGLRPISLFSSEDLDAWGNEHLETLLEHFGVEQKHSSSCGIVVSKPVVDPAQSREEWQKLKRIVKVQGYPRTSTSEVWGLISTYHKEDFPNLLKLANLALTHPVHTSDCERAFSAQNHVTTPLRNRISDVHCDQLMRVMIEGPNLQEFQFREAFSAWKRKKSRAILTFK